MGLVGCTFGLDAIASCSDIKGNVLHRIGTYWTLMGWMHGMVGWDWDIKHAWGLDRDSQEIHASLNGQPNRTRLTVILYRWLTNRAGREEPAPKRKKWLIKLFLWPPWYLPNYRRPLWMSKIQFIKFMGHDNVGFPGAFSCWTKSLSHIHAKMNPASYSRNYLGVFPSCFPFNSRILRKDFNVII